MLSSTLRAALVVALAGVLISFPQAQTTPASGFDIILRGGLVFDGTGAAGYRADVAIAGGHIAALGISPTVARTSTSMSRVCT